jgi:hypothetical protein
MRPASWPAILLAVGLMTACSQRPAEQAEGDRSCVPLPAQREIHGHLVGPTDCRITLRSTVSDHRGRPFRRVDMAVSGTVFGYVVPSATSPNTVASLTDVGPDLAFPQRAVKDPWVPAVGAYDGATGTGLQVLYPDPETGTPWNGKIFMVNHGGAQNARLDAELVPREESKDFNPHVGADSYAGLMIDKGYAVVHTSRPARNGVPATLDDGTVLPERNLDHSAQLMFDFLAIAKRLIEGELGREAVATYWYGHSGGAALGRLINYGGGNVGPDGEPIIDGFLLDDAGGGLPLPVSLRPGDVFGWDGSRITFNEASDTLFEDEESRAAFTRSIDITHQAYLNRHEFLPGPDYPDIKRENARLLIEKGLGEKHRLYEVAGVSHFEAGYMLRDPARGPSDTTLDIGGVMSAFVDILDEWVTKGLEPPPNRSDLPLLGDTTGDGIVDNPAIALPSVACPVGVYFPYPPPDGGASTTGFAAFDGVSPEPVDSRGVHLDVNGNGRRDAMETVEQAWRRLALLGAAERLTHDRYSECVARSTADLVAARLLPPRVAAHYTAQARETFPAASSQP